MQTATQPAVNPAKAHPFAHLALPPYTFLGMAVERCSGQPDANGLIIGSPGQPASSCDYCGTGIANVFRFKGSDGRVFKVGCDCAEKANDANMKRAVKGAIKEHEAEQKRLKVVAVRDAVREIMAAQEETLKARPHPSITSLTLFDYLSWLDQRFLWEKAASVLKAAGHD